MKKNPFDELIKPWIIHQNQPLGIIYVLPGYKVQAERLLARLAKEAPTQGFSTWKVRTE